MHISTCIYRSQNSHKADDARIRRTARATNRGWEGSGEVCAGGGGGGWGWGFGFGVWGALGFRVQGSLGSEASRSDLRVRTFALARVAAIARLSSRIVT